MNTFAFIGDSDEEVEELKACSGPHESDIKFSKNGIVDYLEATFTEDSPFHEDPAVR